MVAVVGTIVGIAMLIKRLGAAAAKGLEDRTEADTDQKQLEASQDPADDKPTNPDAEENPLNPVDATDLDDYDKNNRLNRMQNLTFLPRL